MPPEITGVGPLGGPLLLAGCGGGTTPIAIGVSENERPKMPSGIQFGDVTDSRALIWSRSDRNAQMIVEYDTSDRFNNASRIVGPAASDATDFTTRVDLGGLPAGQTVFVRVRYVDPNNSKIESETISGQFRTTPAAMAPWPCVFTGAATSAARAGASTPILAA